MHTRKRKGSVKSDCAESQANSLDDLESSITSSASTTTTTTTSLNGDEENTSNKKTKPTLGQHRKAYKTEEDASVVQSEGAVHSGYNFPDGDNPSTIGTSVSFIFSTPSSQEGFFQTRSTSDRSVHLRSEVEDDFTVPSDGAVRSERYHREEGDNPSTIGTSDSFYFPTPSSREGFFPTEKTLDDITDVCKDSQQLDIDDECTLPSDIAVRSARHHTDDNLSTIATSDSFIFPTPSSTVGFFSENI